MRRILQFAGPGFIPAMALIAGASLMSASRADVSISDFDAGTYYGGTSGWFAYGSIGVGLEAAPIGNGGNTSNWMWQAPNQYYGQMTNQSWATPGVTVADYVANSKVEFDVIVPGTGAHAWLPSNASQQIEIEFDLGGGVNGEIKKYGYPVINTGLKDQVQHVSFDYSALKPLEADATFWNLSFKTSPGYDWGWDAGNTSGIPYSAYLYYDNVKLSGAVVPEPASLGLLALGGMGIIRRRRA